MILTASRRITAEQQRLFDNAVLIAATRLLFASMRLYFPCPPLREIITIHNGQGLTAKNRDAAGNYDVYAAGGFVGKHSERLTDKSFVVIGRKGSAGKPTYAPDGGWVIDTAYYAQPNETTKLKCKFLFYAISSLDFTDDIISTAIPGINRTAIYSYSIPLPSIDIQEACIHFLDAAANGSRELPSLPPPLEEYRQIVLRVKELATKVEEARGLRSKTIKEIDAFAKAFLDKVYEDSVAKFTATALLEACESITDGDHWTPTFVDSGVKFIFVGNVSSGYLHFNGCKYVNPEYYGAIREHRKPKRGDVLYSAVGATLGIPALVDCDEDFCFQRHVALIKPDRSKLDSKFLWYMLKSGKLFKQAWSGTTGSAQPTVPLRAIRELLIPIPPLLKQKSIVEYLDNLQTQVNSLKRLQTQTAAELDALLPSILDKAFKGEL